MHSLCPHTARAGLQGGQRTSCRGSWPPTAVPPGTPPPTHTHTHTPPTTTTTTTTTTTFALVHQFCLQLTNHLSLPIPAPRPSHSQQPQTSSEQPQGSPASAAAAASSLQQATVHPQLRSAAAAVGLLLRWHLALPAHFLQIGADWRCSAGQQCPLQPEGGSMEKPWEGQGGGVAECNSNSPAKCCSGLKGEHGYRGDEGGKVGSWEEGC